MQKEIKSLLNIDPQDKKEVSAIFDNIARALLTEWVLKVNDVAVMLTEIEFYLFKKKVHEDNYTPSHKLEAGKWRFQNKGLNLTFGSSDTIDGGILIRGIKVGDEYINGPYSVIRKIFSMAASASEPLCVSLQHQEAVSRDIIKTFRNLRGKKVHKKFHKLKYRYFAEFEQAVIPAKNRRHIKKESEKLS
jgi:hypothetical protein